ncbi:MAG: hypothetical protein DRO05_08575 [Thermoproteota archaeon]|nr:MAG: hypothetical protein DRO05_08575 [Candidatus Korarchaeota archaeon]
MIMMIRRRVEWSSALDNFLKQRFRELPLEELKEEIFIKYGINVPELLILHRAEELGLIEESLKDLERGKKPSYLKSQKVWLQGAETIRIEGDVKIPAKEFVPYNLIVCGDFLTEEEVLIIGGVHVKGDAIIGPRNGIGKSIVVEGNLFLGEDTIIGNCVDARGSVFVSRGVVIGFDRDGGGLVSGNIVYMERGTLEKTKIYARDGVRIVDSVSSITSFKRRLSRD